MKPALILGVIAIAGAPAVALSQSSPTSDYDTVGIETFAGALRGNSECLADLQLAFAFSGIIADIAVDEGDEIAAGARLAALDQRIETLEVDRRRAIWQDRAALDAAGIKAAVSAQQYEAAEKLSSAGGAISLEDVQNRKLARDLDAVEVLRLTTQEAVEELDFNTAQEALAKRTMLAPSHGIVAEIVKKPGESVQAYEPVIRLCDVSKIIFVANLPDALGAQLATGDAVTLRFAMGDVTGQVRLVSPVVDAASGLRKIKIDLPDGLAWMRPGLGADLILPPE